MGYIGPRWTRRSFVCGAENATTAELTKPNPRRDIIGAQISPEPKSPWSPSLRGTRVSVEPSLRGAFSSELISHRSPGLRGAVSVELRSPMRNLIGAHIFLGEISLELISSRRDLGSQPTSLQIYHCQAFTPPTIIGKLRA